MKVLVSKMDKLGLLKFVLIYYAVIYIALALVMPVTVLILDPSLFLNPTILVIVIGIVLFFGLIGYFTFIRPYIEYNKLPSVLAETDGEYVYFYGKNEVKISLVDLSYCYMDVDVPHVFQPGFIREFIIQKFSYDYGTISLDVPGHKTVKLKFVANAQEVAKELLDYINQNS
ncbi:MAG: hypothetical protein E7358_03525 [Clostridiales bacterium]|nr:hypothetical protein [Clostridiales bacterium]